MDAWTPAGVRGLAGPDPAIGPSRSVIASVSPLPLAGGSDTRAAGPGRPSA